jgi:hypothetical protein
VKRPISSTATLMAVVAAVAVTAGIVRVFTPINPNYPAAIAPMAFALQLGSIGLIRTHGRARAFWVGFVAAGSLALLSLLFGLAFHGSTLNRLWYFYFEFTGIPLFEWFPQVFMREAIRVPATAAILLVPQLFAALFGGLLARGIARQRLGPIPVSPTMTPSTSDPRGAGDPSTPGP